MTTSFSSLLINKLTALVLIILGFLILASGYRYGSPSSLLGGFLVLVVGIVLLVLKIMRRNTPDPAG